MTSAAESLSLIKDALGKRATPRGKAAADMIALNAGAAIYVSGLANDLRQGVAMAEDTIATGLALEKLTDLAEICHKSWQLQADLAGRPCHNNSF